MYCKHCGNEVEQGQKFCGKCGKSIEYIENTTTNAADYELANSKSRKPKTPIILALLVVVAIIVLGLGGYLFFGGPKDEAGSSTDTGGEVLLAFDNAMSKVRNADEAREAVLRCSNQIGMLNADDQLGECSAEKYSGETYYQFNQNYQGIPIYGRSLTLNVDSSGTCIMLSGDMLPVEDVKTDAAIDKSAVQQAILEDAPGAYLRTEPELMIYPEKDGGYSLTYAIDVTVGDTWKRYFVSAETASIVAVEQLNSDENVGSMFTADYGITAYDASKKEIEQKPLTGTDENSARYTFKIESDGSYYFIDNTGAQLDDDNGAYYIQLKKNGKVVARKAGVSSVSIIVDGKGLSPAEVNLQRMSKSDDKTMALINNATYAMDFYEDVLGRKSYNGEAGNVTLVSNAKITWEHEGKKIPDPTNAYSGFTTPYQTSLVFGYDNSAPLDTVGHEFTHSVEASICAMEYAGESGALKEGTSDIFGELIEDYQDNKAMDGSCDWKHGSRSLIDPNNGDGTSNDDGKYPASYKQSGYWGDTNDDGLNNDHGNVHKNATVVSHAAYLMCKGSLDGEALTTAELAQIQLASFYMLTKRCPFSLYAGVMERKAQDLLTPEKAKRVKAAFHAVGINSIEVVYAEQTDSSNTDDDDNTDRYAAYLQKIEDYQSKYGEGKIVAVGTSTNTKCMKGLCLADLIDFDNDGDMELLLGYYDESQANYYASDSFADAQAYRAEIWGYENGSISRLYESDFHWTNGGFAYLPVYQRSNDVAMYKVDYSTDSDNRSVGTNSIWVLKGDAFGEITTFSTYGMWGTGKVEYEIDGNIVDEGTYKTHFDDVMGDYAKTSYWMTWNDESSHHQDGRETLNDPNATLKITRDTIRKLRGESDSAGTDEAWTQFPQSFIFTSGAGAWSTELDVDSDGSFSGYYHDSDMGDRGSGYPNGTRHEAHFVGEFTTPVKVSEFEYSMQLNRLEITDSPGETVEDGVRVVHVTDSVYGLGEPTEQPAGEFSLHLPGQSLSSFSDSAASWLFIKNTSSQGSDFYAIVNSSDPSYDLAFRTTESKGATTAQNADEESKLKSFVEANAGHEILYWFYEDFDGDGSREAMAIAGIKNEARNYEGEWTDGEIWYANKDGSRQVGWSGSGNALNGLVKDGKTGYTFLSIERDGHGSGSSSEVYVVESDGCSVALFDVDSVGDFHNDNDRLIGYTQTWENGFHEYAWHEFEFHPENATFTSKGVFDVTSSRQY